MPAEFEQGFFVRVPAWHGLGVVLADYPGREEAMRLAGHAWDVVELPSLTAIPFGHELAPMAEASDDWHRNGNGYLHKDGGFKSHVRGDTLALLHKSRETFERIPNSVAYDFAELLLDQGFKYETGITLKGGALCALTLLLDEPIQIPGDNSQMLPYLGLAWAHDGSASLRGNPTTVRRVCANTVQMSEAEGRKLGASFSIRHTKNWRAKVEDAKRAMQGVRAQSQAIETLGRELAAMYFDTEHVTEFVERFTAPPEVLTAAMTSDRVKANIVQAQGKLRGILAGDTVPEAHRQTGWGLYNAAVEFLDHVRPTRGSDERAKGESYTNRTLLTHNRAKDGALELIRGMAR